MTQLTPQQEAAWDADPRHAEYVAAAARANSLRDISRAVHAVAAVADAGGLHLTAHRLRCISDELEERRGDAYGKYQELYRTLREAVGAPVEE